MRTAAALLLAGAAACAADERPVFPPRGDRTALAFEGAQGFGAFSIGGRGGAALRVTRLADDRMQGSLRWAIEQEYPRIVTFDVEGIIELDSDLTIRAPYLTLDGSTAPGAGITLKDGTLAVKETHDVIIRHLRVRPGDQAALRKGRFAERPRDGGAPSDAVSVYRSRDVIIDHVSASWSSDEVLSTTESELVTVQRCFITEPLANPALHIEDGTPIAHAYGALVGLTDISYVGNLFAYFKIRGPQLSPGTESQPARSAAVGNLVAFYEGSGTRVKASRWPSAYVVMDNVYRFPLKEKAPDVHVLLDEKGGAPEDTVGHTAIWLEGNLGPHRAAQDLDAWASAELDFGARFASSLRAGAPPFEIPALERVPAAEVPERVLDGAGATLPRRDPIDTRVAAQVRAGTGRVIESQDEVGAW